MYCNFLSRISWRKCWMLLLPISGMFWLNATLSGSFWCRASTASTTWSQIRSPSLRVTWTAGSPTSGGWYRTSVPLLLTSVQINSAENITFGWTWSFIRLMPQCLLTEVATICFINVLWMTMMSYVESSETRCMVVQKKSSLGAVKVFFMVLNKVTTTYTWFTLKD